MSQLWITSHVAKVFFLWKTSHLLRGTFTRATKLVKVVATATRMVTPRGPFARANGSISWSPDWFILGRSDLSILRLQHDPDLWEYMSIIRILWVLRELWATARTEHIGNPTVFLYQWKSPSDFGRSQTLNHVRSSRWMVTRTTNKFETPNKTRIFFRLWLCFSTFFFQWNPPNSHGLPSKKHTSLTPFTWHWLPGRPTLESAPDSREGFHPWRLRPVDPFFLQSLGDVHRQYTVRWFSIVESRFKRLGTPRLQAFGAPVIHKAWREIVVTRLWCHGDPSWVGWIFGLQKQLFQRNDVIDPKKARDAKPTTGTATCHHQVSFVFSWVKSSVCSLNLI